LPSPPARFGKTPYGWAMPRGEPRWLAEVNAFLAQSRAAGARAAAGPCGIRSVAHDQLHVAREVRAMAGGEIIEHAHAMSLRAQRLDEVGSDEAGTAGDEMEGHGAEAPFQVAEGQEQAACRMGIAAREAAREAHTVPNRIPCT
jgi:hypothetical protein